MDEQERFLAAEHAALLRAAFLLTGEQASAQDLTQETFVRVLVQWKRVARADSPQAYTRRVMLNVFLAGQRRGWSREIAHEQLPDTGVLAPYAAVEDHEEVRRALLALPPRQRAAVVLRHYEDRSEAQTAELMGCSIGTVKSLTSRGLASLRLSLGHVRQDLPRGGTA